MSYAEALSEVPAVKVRQREMFNEMITCEGLKAEISEVRDAEKVETLFEKYGYKKASLKVRTVYLAWVMGYADSFDDEFYMKKMYAARLKAELEERKKAVV